MSPISLDVVFQQHYEKRVAMVCSSAHAQGYNDGAGTMFGLFEKLEKDVGRAVSAEEVKAYLKEQYNQFSALDLKARNDAQNASTNLDDVSINKDAETSVSVDPKIIKLFPGKK